MTDAQFLQWARAYNQRRLAEWRALKEQAKADQPQYNIVQTTETRGSYDMGNVCGQGYRQQTTIIETDNPNYVSPGPFTIVNPFCPRRPSTAEEQAEIKRTYKVAGGKVLTVRSADDTPSISRWYNEQRSQ